MTAHELIAEVTKLGIVLEARGGRLHVEAPAGVVTPELRETLSRHKVALLALLVPVTEFVTLKDGPTLPLPAVVLALDLERRGFRQWLDAANQYQIEGGGLTDDDRTAIARWRMHLGAIIGYTAPEIA